MQLTRLAITRPITILMLVLALVVLGLQSRDKLPVDLYPKIDFPMLFISTVYTGTGPEEMETLITKPIEDQVSTISGLKKLTSTSSEGISNVVMELELGTDIDTAASDVRSKLDAIRNQLPQDAKAPVVQKLDVSAMPVVTICISSQRRRSQDVRQLADDVVKDRLSQLAGVASVDVAGGDVREIRVAVDKDRLEAYGLNINQVVNALAAENLNLPSGTIKEHARDYAVRVMGEFTKPEQILNVRIASATNPNLTVGDIATVNDTIAEPEQITRLNRGPSVTLTVQKQSDGNTVKIVEEVRHEMEVLTGKPFTEEATRVGHVSKDVAAKPHDLPDDVTAMVAFDQSTFIKETLDDVYSSLLDGSLLAILIVFLFLHSLRGTLIVGLAIPTSMIATFTIMHFAGFSANMMSMLGLSLSVGILVDDSIVVIENIHRHLRMGESPKEAALNGRTEIGLAAMTITMVDVVVFVPIAFMGGIVGQFFRQFGVVVATATLFSLFISFTLTPMLASRWLKSHEEEEQDLARQREHPGLFYRFTQAWEAGYNRLDHLYRLILAWALDHRPVVICLGVMTLLASIASAVPKPALSEYLTALPALLGCLVLFVLLWSVVRLLSGWPRALYTMLALVISVFACVTGMQKHVFPLLLFFLALILMLGAAAYMLSLPPKDAPPCDTKAITGPLLSWMAVLAAVLLFLPTAFTFEFQPKVDRRQFSVTIQEDVGTPLEMTDAEVRKIEDTLLDPKKYPETKTVTTTIGSTGGSMMSAGSTGADLGSLNVELKDLSELKLPAAQQALIQLGLLPSPVLSTDDVVKKVNADFGQDPGVKVTATMTSGGGGGGSGAPVDIEVSGADIQRTQQVAGQIENILKQTKGTYSTQLSWREGRPEIQARIDRDRAAQYGISVSQIASALRTSLDGDTTTKYRENGKEYDIRVVLPKTERAQINQVPKMVIGTRPTGEPIYLDEVVSLLPAGGPTKVERVSRQRAVTVSAQLDKGFALGNVQQEVNKTIAAQQLDLTGVSVNWAGQAEFMTESFAYMGDALRLSIILVFMLMAALFESLLAPLIIMMSVPMAMAGAIFALTITHKTLSIVSAIGVIMLVGLVTKNAILMVDYTNTLRHDHDMDRRKALLEAGPTRLRPILMTTLAMIFGMLPTAIALAKGSEMRQPMAISVIGGLLLSLLLTLLMVPVFYEIIDDGANRLTQMKDGLLRCFSPKERKKIVEPEHSKN